MKYIHRLILLSTLLCLSYSFPAYSHANNINEARLKTIHQYLNNLQNADYKDMKNIFSQNAIVVSTSRGKLDAIEFFNAFLPEVTAGNTQLHQTFISYDDKDRLAARFHLNLQLKDDEKVNGEFVDEFIFDKDSEKLTAVYMFENLKFPPA